MKPKRPHTPVVWLSSFLFLVTSLNSTPSIPSVPAPGPEPPTAAEVATLDELTAWLHGGSGQGILASMSPNDLRDAIRAKPRTFELFRRYNDREERRKLVYTLPFGEKIFAAAQRHHLDSLLVAAVVEAESGFESTVVSPQGAVGLMQLMPDTGKRYGVADLTDPAANLEAGSRYLRELLDGYGGDLELALAAYNAGPANVDRFGGVPPFRETRGYIARVLSVYVANHRRVWDRSGTSALLALN
jgi:soluble lytic murein transglycosylase-like protein